MAFVHKRILAIKSEIVLFPGKWIVRSSDPHAKENEPMIFLYLEEGTWGADS